MTNIPDNSVINFTDTAQGENGEKFSENIENTDTTNERLKLWHTLYDKFALYKEGKEKIEVEEKQNYTLIGSEVGNSIQTSAQAIAYLQDLVEGTKSKVILINNASRAKHKNVKDSGGSYPYIIDIEINGTTHHITGVDDEALLFFTPFIKKGSKVRKITGIKDTWSGDKIWGKIEDTSKNTQFRSKDHFPLIQHIIIKVLEENTNISEEELNTKLEKYLVSENLNTENSENKGKIKRKLVHIKKDIKNQLGDILDGEKKLNFNELVNKYIEKVRTELPKISENGGVLVDNGEGEKVKYEKEYLEGFEGIETIQLIGEIHQFIEKFGVKDFSKDIEKEGLGLNKIRILFASVGLNYDKYIENNLGFNDLLLNNIKIYKETRENLETNELCIIDRDKFGNGIFTYSNGVENGIDGFVKINGFNLDEEIEIEDENGSILFSGYLTKNIGDKTGENCIWNSSSRGLDGENLLNINKSFGENYTPVREIQKLPIGNKLSISKKNSEDNDEYM